VAEGATVGGADGWLDEGAEADGEADPGGTLPAGDADPPGTTAALLGDGDSVADEAANGPHVIAAKTTRTIPTTPTIKPRTTPPRPDRSFGIMVRRYAEPGDRLAPHALESHA
jgi:hypothetical protein